MCNNKSLETQIKKLLNGYKTEECLAKTLMTFDECNS